MTPIRPNAFPVQTPAPSAPGAEAARAAAQKAFFDAAMGRAAAAQPATAASAPGFASAPAPAPAARAPDSAAQPPTRPLRPGSLLDIRV